MRNTHVFLLLFFLFLFVNPLQAQQIYLENKIIPKNIENEALRALEYFPKLYDTPIEFKFKKKIKKATMQAQPKIGSLLNRKENRKYVIYLSESIQIDDEDFTISDIPSDVLVGWICHELGHIMDYQERSNLGMIIFGAKYLFSSKSIKRVERTADMHAISQGTGEYILKKKNFILENPLISETYKERIRKLYISPDEVMSLLSEERIEDDYKFLEASSN
ncbi:MAG TPA: hypothetical protein VKX34_02885 [Aequorivita sp.]|nr:hypothetical protein [Aequorivita sp.]